MAPSGMAAVEHGLDLKRLMSRISSRAREAIQYVKVEGPSVREGGAQCRVSESAVKLAVYRGLKALLSEIGKEKAS